MHAVWEYNEDNAQPQDQKSISCYLQYLILFMCYNMKKILLGVEGTSSSIRNSLGDVLSLLSCSTDTSLSNRGDGFVSVRI